MPNFVVAPLPVPCCSANTCNGLWETQKLPVENGWFQLLKRVFLGGRHFKSKVCRAFSVVEDVLLRTAAFASALAIALVAFDPSWSFAAPANRAEAFVQQNMDKGYAILNASLSDEQRRAQFRDFMLSLTDPHRIGVFTLGQYANGASQADLGAFESAFTDYVVAVYESRLSKYRGRTVRVTGSIERSADDVIVNAVVINPSNPSVPPINAAFRVRMTNDGRSIVTDIQVEGIWLALSERSDFTAFLQQHRGRISDLISDMTRRTQMLVPADSK